MIKLEDKDDNEGGLRDLAPDLTPLIDIVFILIVFLILTSNPAVMSLVVDLPQKGSSELEQTEMVSDYRLQIIANGGYSYKGEKLDEIQSLKEKLSSDFSNLSSNSSSDSDSPSPETKKELVIASDKSVKVEDFLEVLSLIEELQIKNTRVLMGAE